jgi:hypothetical protein
MLIASGIAPSVSRLVLSRPFLPALNFAHRARWNAAIFLRAAADIVRFTGTVPDIFVPETNTGCDPFRTFAHLAFCARAIFNREAFDVKRFGADGDADADVIPVDWLVVRDAPEPFNDSIAEIAVSNFSTCNCTSLRSARSCWSAFARFPIVPPSI